LTFKKLNPVQSILITGGSGYVGSHLTTLLLQNGYKVSHLSESGKPYVKVQQYRWNPSAGTIDAEAFDKIDCIVHLAGASIGKRRWNKNTKREIADSRIKSAKLIFDTIYSKKLNLKAFISASAIGYYGYSDDDRVFSEKDLPSDDFLGETCRLWEEAADQFAGSGIRTVKIRTGIVIGKNAPAFEKLYKPARFGFPIRLGNGKQYMPWIHIDDLSKIYLKAIENENYSGSFNAVSPENVSNGEFMRVIAEIIDRRFLILPVPSILLKLVLGEMSSLVLNGNRVYPERLLESGYSFQYPEIKLALNNIIKNS
jgi:uncharacterized protein